jgi:hypothetical protein
MQSQFERAIGGVARGRRGMANHGSEFTLVAAIIVYDGRKTQQKR